MRTQDKPFQEQDNTYERPTVVDYGSLTELTASATPGHHEDGLSKGPDVSSPMR